MTFAIIVKDQHGAVMRTIDDNQIDYYLLSQGPGGDVFAQLRAGNEARFEGVKVLSWHFDNQQLTIVCDYP